MANVKTGGWGCGALRRGAAAGLFLALAFTAVPARAGDNAAFVSSSGVPPRMERGGKATVTVRMLNTGTTTWRTSVVEETSGGTKTTTRTSFSLDSIGDDWGVKGVPVTGSVAPNAPRSFRFTITAPSKIGSYTFQWRMVRSTVVTERPIIPAKPGEGFGARTDAMTILVEPDESPSFKGTVDDQEWLTGRAISPVVTLPDAMGGNGALSYALSCALPPGVKFNEPRKRISGTPSREWPRKTCTWKVTDVDGDADTETFTISAKRPALILKPTKLEVEEGKSKSFTVKLAARPQGNVTVSLSSADAGAADVDHTSLTFNRDNYGRTQEVTVEGKQDKDRDDESTNIRLRASGGGYDRVTASLPVAVTDDDTEPPPPELPPVDDQVWPKGKPVSKTLPAATGGSGGLTYSLSPDPPLPGVTFNPSTRILSGTPTQAQDAKTYTYTVTDSKDEEAFREFTIGVAALVVNPTSLEITEGGSGTFAVKLAAKPKNSVVVSVTSRDTGAVSVARGSTSLTFTEANYSQTQMVTVDGEQDVDASDESTIIDLRARGGGYDGVSATVVVTVNDDEEPAQPGLVVDPASLTIKEGETAEFTVKLATQPTAGVTVSVTSANAGVASVNRGSLTFSRTGYGKEQTVTVTGKRNPPSDTTQINLRAKGGNYAGITKSVPVTIDGAPSFSGRASNQVWERGRRVSVTLPVATGGNGELEYSLSRPWPAGVTFNSSTRVLSGTPTTLRTATTYTYTVTDSDGNRGAGDRDTQTFTIEVVDPDPDPDPNTSPVFSGKVPAQKWTKDKAVSVTLPGATGGEGALTYKLTPKPPDGVTFDPASRLLSGKPTATQAAVSYTYTATDSDDDTSAGDMARQSFTITVAAPDTAPELTGTVPDQQWVTGQRITPLTLPAATGGNGELTYSLSPDPPDGVSFNPSTRLLSGTPAGTQAATAYTYTVTDSDENTTASDADTDEFTITVRRVGLLLSETELAVDEGVGGSAFTVKLASQPTAVVTVEVASSDPGAVEATPARLTFTAADYGEPRPVTVAGVPDPGFEDETTKVGLRAIGGGYDGVVKVVTVTVDDDDVDTVPELAGEFDALEWLAGRAIDPVVLPAGTGGNAPLRYSLSPDPPDGVTFDPATRTLSGTPAEARAAATYTYTAADSDENTSETDAAAGEFTITVKQAALVSSKASLAVEEGGAGGTFTVKLAALPKADVTVSLKSGDAGAASVSPASLTFTAANHNVARTVTVKGAQDDDFDDETTEITLSATGGGYDGETATVDVTVDDDETDTAPVFDAQMDDIEWVANRAFEPFALPEASGGNGDLTYTLSPDPPEGVVFDPGTRTLTGTPKSPQDATEYTYKATDADGNTDAADTATLTFTIEVWLDGLDDAAFVSHAGVPETMLAGDKATVTVRMRNTGSTTWRSASYRLGSQRPQDNEIWGLARVSLPADVAPDETVDLTFAITAPMEVGNHKFRWRMVRGASGWFGGKTDLLTIAVEDPSFLGQEIPDQMWVKDDTVVSLTLPEARGNGGALTYSLKPALPDGVTFTETTRLLAGTPEALLEATEYRYVATDTSGGKAKLTFEIAVEEGVIDDAAVVSVTGLPSKMAAGGTATVTVTMTNTGTTTWSSPAGYGLGSWDRSDKDRWGVRRAAVPGTVAPNETAGFTFDVTAPKTPGVHPFTWRMVRDPRGWFGADTTDVSVTVEDPSFGDETVADQTWMQGEALDELVLPAAGGTAGPFGYAISPDLPDGVTFAESTRTVSGTPEAAQAATRYSYTATDADGGTATLSFGITVEALATDDATFVSQTAVPEKMAAGSEAVVTVRMRNTGTTTWTKASGYALGSQRPDDNERWGLKRVSPPEDVAPDATVDFTFTITAPTEVGRPGFRWRMVRGADGWFGRKTDLRTIEVEDPSFGDAAIGDQRWAKDAAIATLLLHEADGTAGPFTYSLTPELPDGVTFDGSKRTISGRPTAVLEETEYAYTATGTNGGTATLTFLVTVSEHAVAAAAAQGAASAPPPSSGVAFEFRNGVQGGRRESDGAGTPGWLADSGDATISRVPTGLALRLRGSDAGGDEADDAVVTEQWIPVEGGTYRLSACMLRENASDDVYVDFDGGAGRDGDFLDVHIVATETGVWECGAVTKCIPESVGAVRVRAVREGANLGDAWFDRIQLKRLAPCGRKVRDTPP